MSAVPPTRQVMTNLVSTYNPVDGYAPNKRTQQYALPNPLVDNPPVLLGVDFVVATPDMDVITFPNLPIRGINNPALQSRNQPQDLTIPQGDLLLFEVTSGTPNIIDTSKKNLPYNAVGPGVYKTFQAVLPFGRSESVTVWGRIYLCRGAGQ